MAIIKMNSGASPISTNGTPISAIGVSSINTDVTVDQLDPIRTEQYEESVVTESIPLLETDTTESYFNKIEAELVKVKPLPLYTLDAKYDSIQILNQYNQVNSPDGTLTLKDLLNIFRSTYNSLSSVVSLNDGIYRKLILDSADQITIAMGQIQTLGNTIVEVESGLTVKVDEVKAYVDTNINTINGSIQQTNQLVIDQQGLTLSAVRNELNAYGNWVSQNYASISVLNNRISLLVTQSTFNSLGNLVDQHTSSITQLADSITSKVDSYQLDALGQIVSQQGSTITQLSDEIDLRVTTTEFDTYKTSVTNSYVTIGQHSVDIGVINTTFNEVGETLEIHNTNIQANTNAIELRATTSTVNDLTGRVTTAEGDITIASDKISMLVTVDNTIKAGVIVDAINNGTVNIIGARVNIDGTTTFSSGYNPYDKSRTFLTTPYPPYKAGDYWLNNEELYVSDVTRLTGVYIVSDWRKATKYTDDTLARSKNQRFITDYFIDPITLIDNDPLKNLSNDQKAYHVGDEWLANDWELNSEGSVTGLGEKRKAFIYANGLYSWIMDSTVVDAGRITTGYISADRIDINELFAKAITATNLTVTNGRIGNFVVNNTLVGTGNGNSITLDPDNTRVFIQDSIGRSIDIKAGALNPILALVGSNFNWKNTNYNAGSSNYPVVYRADLETYNNFVHNSPHRIKCISVPSIGTGALAIVRDAITTPDYIVLTSTGKATTYTFDVPVQLLLKHSTLKHDGRYDRRKGELQYKIVVSICNSSGVTVSSTSTHADAIYIDDQTTDTLKWEMIHKLQVVVPDGGGSYYVKVDTQVAGTLCYYEWKDPTIGGGEWHRDLGDDNPIQFAINTDSRFAINAAQGKTELTTDGFQSVWSQATYFRIDGNNPTNFIESAGRWIHNGVEVVFTTAGLSGILALDLYQKTIDADNKYLAKPTSSDMTSGNIPYWDGSKFANTHFKRTGVNTTSFGELNTPLLNVRFQSSSYIDLSFNNPAGGYSTGLHVGGYYQIVNQANNHSIITCGVDASGNGIRFGNGPSASMFYGNSGRVGIGYHLYEIPSTFAVKGVTGTPTVWIETPVVAGTPGITKSIVLKHPTLGEQDGGGYGTGIFFAVNLVKAGIVFERRGSYGVGTMHFLQRDAAGDTGVDLTHSVMAINKNGKVSIGYGTTPDDYYNLNVKGGIKAEDTGVRIHTTSAAYWAPRIDFGMTYGVATWNAASIISDYHGGKLVTAEGVTLSPIDSIVNALHFIGGRRDSDSNYAFRNNSGVLLAAITKDGDVIAKNNVSAKTYNNYKPVNDEGGIIYHTRPRVENVGTISSNGTTVTSSAGWIFQSSPSMVNHVIIVGTERRVITARINDATCTIDVPFTNDLVNSSYKIVAPVFRTATVEEHTNWGISFMIYDPLGNVDLQTAYDRIYATRIWGEPQHNAGFAPKTQDVVRLGGDKHIVWHPYSSGNALNLPKDVGIRRNDLGVLEIFDGITVNNYRDLKLRNLTASSTVTASAFNNGQVYGTNSANARNHFVQYNAGNINANTGWIAAAFGDATSDRTVIGQYDGRAIIGAHSPNLNAWGTLFLNPDGNIYLGLNNGFVSVGNASNQGAKLGVKGLVHIGQFSNGTVAIDAYGGNAYFGCNQTENGLYIDTAGTTVTKTVIAKTDGMFNIIAKAINKNYTNLVFKSKNDTSIGALNANDATEYGGDITRSSNSLNVWGESAVTIGHSLTPFAIFDTNNKRVAIGSNIVPTEALHVVGNIKLTGQAIVGTDLVKASGFASGFAGYGWRLDGGDSNHLTVDNLTVRKSMNVYELVINQIRATNGSLWVSDSQRITWYWNDGAGNEYIYTDAEIVNGIPKKPRVFKVNDILLCQKWDGRNIKRSVIKVIDLPANDLSGYKIKSLEGGYPEPNDDFVRIGNTSDTTRQGSIYLTSSDNGAPYIDVLDGVVDSAFNIPLTIRYVRDWLNGSTQNAGNHWVDIAVWNTSGNNVATSGTITSNYDIIDDYNIIDDNVDTDYYADGTVGTNQYVLLDLGTLTDCASIGVYHYFGDNRTYYGTKTEVSADGITWHTLHDANIHGTYTETYEGRIYKLGASKTKVRLGKLSGIFDPYMGTLNGYGLYSDNVFLKGKIIAQSGKIGGWSINSEGINDYYSRTHIISKGYGFNGMVLSPTYTLTPTTATNRVQVWANPADNTYGVKAVASGNTIFELGSTNKIAGWNFTATRLYTGADWGTGVAGIGLFNESGYKMLHAYKDSVNYIRLGYGIDGGTAWGITGTVSSALVFQLGSTNKIAGWTFTDYQLTCNNLHLHAGQSSIWVDKPGGGHVMIGQTFINSQWTNNYGISATDSGGNELFRLDNSVNRIAGWTFNTNTLYSGVSDGSQGVGLYMSTSNRGSGYIFAHERWLEGFVYTWHRSDNAGHIVFGQVTTDGINYKNCFRGIQMMDWQGREYFCLSANVDAAGYREVYNRIGGCAFDNTSIYSANNLWRLNSDGSGYFANGKIGWDSAGVLSLSAGLLTNDIVSHNYSTVLGSKLELATGIFYLGGERIVLDATDVSGKLIKVKADSGVDGVYIGNFTLTTPSSLIGNEIISNSSAQVNDFYTAGVANYGSNYEVAMSNIQIGYIAATNAGAFTINDSVSNIVLSANTTYTFTIPLILTLTQLSNSFDVVASDVMGSTCDFLGGGAEGVLTVTFTDENNNVITSASRTIDSYSIKTITTVCKTSSSGIVRLKLTFTGSASVNTDFEDVYTFYEFIINLKCGGVFYAQAKGGITELSSKGFQVLKDTTNYFKIDQIADTTLNTVNYIESQGRWVHNAAFISKVLNKGIIATLNSGTYAIGSNLNYGNVFVIKAMGSGTFISLPTYSQIEAIYGYGNSDTFTITIVLEKGSAYSSTISSTYYDNAGVAVTNKVLAIGDTLTVMMISGYWQLLNLHQ